MESAVYMKFSDNLLSMWAVTLGVSTWELPQTSSLRICFISFVWYCYALVTIYLTFFTSLLVDPGLGRQITSFDEIMHSGIAYGYDPFLKYFFDEGKLGKRLEDTVDSYVNCTDRLHCFDLLSISRDFALYDTTEALNYYLVKNEDASVCAIDEFTYTFQRNFYFRLGSNFFRHFNRVVRDLKESGLFQKIMDDYYRKLRVEDIELDEFHRIEDAKIPAADHNVSANYFVFTVFHLSTKLKIKLIVHLLALAHSGLESIRQKLAYTDSVSKIKNKGDSPSSCFSPQWIGKHPTETGLYRLYLYMKFSDNLLSMWAVTLGASTWELPQTSSPRICFISFVWYCYALMTIYLTFFTSLLVDPGLGRQITTFHEIMHSGIEYGYDPFLKYFFDGDNVGIRLKNTVDSYVNCTDRLHCFDRVSISRDFALYDTTEALNYYLVKNEDASVCAIDEFTYTFQRNFYFRLGSNFFDHFNRVVRDLKESGLFQKIMDDYYRKLKVEDIELDEFHRIEDAIIPPADHNVSADYFVFTVFHLSMSENLVYKPDVVFELLLQDSVPGDPVYEECSENEDNVPDLAPCVYHLFGKLKERSLKMMTPSCTLLKSGSDELVQTFIVQTTVPIYYYYYYYYYYY
ncbi:hypothetical protein ANN_05352 [Periplaneta americana]|uniref:Uncharacterized protein n=1 Tax=Periplaneta americana TaxID=6978 RepID=A0ABQ8TCR2_PERAM|nr:hypothetical protein ANN_05352 [Periplaneta americana]